MALQEKPAVRQTRVKSRALLQRSFILCSLGSSQSIKSCSIVVSPPAGIEIPVAYILMFRGKDPRKNRLAMYSYVL